VVLATAMVPSKDSGRVGQLFGLSTDSDGWFQEAHPKLKPVETFTGGVYLAGSCQGPKDIPDTVAQASGAAAKVAVLFSKDEMATSPLITGVNEQVCSGCGLCVSICPYKAIELKTIEDRARGKRQVASINSGLCQGCGACAVACRAGALDLKGFTNEQILAEVDALCL
jgi:heterodisulfide reductase subunit A